MKEIFHAQRQLLTGNIDIHYAHKQDNGLWVAQEVLMKRIETGMQADAFLRISTTAAQNLMDELWNCGLRPSEGTGSAGSLAATERHLKDLQRIVFKDKHANS